MNMKIERNTTPHLTLMIIGSLIFLFGGSLHFGTDIALIGNIMLGCGVFCIIVAISSMMKMRKQFLDVSEKEITAKMLNGNSKVVDMKDIHSAMFTTKRLLGNSINPKYLYVELRSENGDVLMKIARQSFNQVKILKLIDYLESIGVEIVEE
ncbi:hypothetical protein ACOMCU_01715 [Lysinibacillus sp. UGB7]|uniref:hypothetical protein n=1 Tax=Lysinibacillus sp. UGB7 TaxID=3411039 RepID=UPI003B78AF03